jgi:hypothetical protein
MKKLFVSMGLAAASVASVQLTHADGANGVDSKVWSVSASLRGFYDDNYSTAPNKTGSYGLEVSPQVSVSVPLRQTEVGLRYTYGLYYYQQREDLNVNAFDQSHDFDLWVDHAFSETWHGKAEDTFVYSQEPQLATSGFNASIPTTGGSLLRTKEDNIGNTADLTLSTDWTKEISTVLIYQNAYFDYDNSTVGFTPGSSTGAPPVGLGSLLNRDENDASIDLDWILSPHTTFLVGYQLGFVNYNNGSDAIGYNTVSPYLPNSFARFRDNVSHTGYVGADVDLLANLRFEGKAGVSYYDYYNTTDKETDVSPYAVLSLTYTYLPGSYAQLGFDETQTAVDVAAVNASGAVTQDQQSSDLYASINQKITSKLVGSIIGSYDYLTYNKGGYDGKNDNFYSVTLNFSYAFNRHFSAEAGYNYYDLKSDVAGRGYERNVVYIGLSASY